MRVTYHAIPQHLLEGRWCECQPNEAKRWAVIRKNWGTKKRGQARPAPKQRVLATFFGPDACACAEALVRHSAALQRAPRPKSKPRILYQSLTKQQWLDAQRAASASTSTTTTPAGEH